MAQWLELEFTDRKVRGSNSASASRLTLSSKNHPVVTPFRCLAAIPLEGGMKAGILPGCPSLDRGSRVRTTDLWVSEFSLQPLSHFASPRDSWRMQQVTALSELITHCVVKQWHVRVELKPLFSKPSGGTRDFERLSIGLGGRLPSTTRNN
ncbi:hypothetical protein T265_11573 [Opisthorchis viverrini]|uniref:Uncharacterized protein n=1 Tax=Opisthorchis viverrini TaxID=6198 RepID=A0A074Z924_OPIVI|nr:hypothetical protein T265_11573 [Opisthorchis viverrini]KER19725.1 hypothetical protein T265_11573 [Opisthorchis viverrini]